MNYVDIIAIVIIALGALIGFFKGAIKSIVKLIGTVAIIIVAYQFKDILANVYIDKLPFYNFLGFENLYAMNFVIYQTISFVVIYLLLYCILNILVNISGLIDILLKATIIFDIPSKIIGMILGAVEATVFVFILGFCLMQIGPTQKYVMESKVTKTIVERTPLVNSVFKKSIKANEQIYDIIKNNKDNNDSVEVDLSIVRALISNGIVDAKTVQKHIDNGKLQMPNVVVSS